MWPDVLPTIVRKLRGSSSSAEVARGAMGAFTVRIAGAGLPFVLHLVLVRVLGVEGYGRYVYVIGWVNLLAALARLGVGRPAIRYGAVYWEQRDWARFKGLLTTLTGIVIAAATLFGVGLAVGGQLLGSAQHTDMLWGFRLGGLGVVACATQFVLQNLVRAQGRPTLAVASQFIVIRVVLIALVGMSFLATGGLSSTMAVGLHVVAWTSAGMFLLIKLRGNAPQSWRDVRPRRELEDWRRGTLSYFIINVANVVRNQSDVVLVGMLLSPADLAVYSIAKHVAEVTNWGTLAMNAAVAPVIARLHAREEFTELRRLVYRATLGVAAVTLLVAAGLALIGPWVLELFGRTMMGAFLPMLILLVGRFVNATSAPGRQVLVMTEREREAMLVNVISTVCFVALVLLWAPRYAAPGAALAASVVAVASSLFIVARVRVHLASS